MVLNYPLDKKKEERKLRLNNVFENIKERMIREDSKDNYELPISRGKGKKAPIADAIFVDERVYNELDYIEQKILVAGMSLINIDIYEAKSGYRCKPDPIYVNEIQKALAKRVELSTMAKDPVVEIASRAILYELIIVMCHIWKCVRVKYDIR